MNHRLIHAVAVLTILLYAPVENPNKPLDGNQRSVNHKRSVICVVGLSAGNCDFNPPPVKWTEKKTKIFYEVTESNL